MTLPPFHHAFPVDDLAAARRFYGELLGCPEGRSAEDWVDFGEPLEIWIQDTAAALAQAVVAAASVIDFSAAVIDGGFPAWIRERVVTATRAALGKHDLQGVIMPEILEGEAGSQARTIGAASLPLFARYLLDQNVLFKETA